MAKKAGRKSLYESHIMPYLDLVDKWLNEGATEKQVAENLGIAYSTWNVYKTQYQELKTVCEKPRAALVDQLRGALVKKALGFQYEETKTYIKQENDGQETTYTEIITKYSVPDTTAIFGALNLYDEDYVKDRKQHELRLRELELKEKQAEKDDW